MSRNIYIVNEGKLSVDETTFRFDSVDGLRRFPVLETEAIEFLGGGNLTSGVFSIASKNNIPIHFFGFYGNYEGTYWPKEMHFSGDLSIKQAALFLDFKKRIELCNILVNGIRKNMNRTITHYMKSCDELYNKIIVKENIQDLMMEEGRLWKKYYSNIDEVVSEEFRLEQRIKHPTLNYGNSLISFLNSLLYAEIITQCKHVSLNPSISFYHSPSRSRFSLALDISEVFKPIFVTRLFVSLCNKSILQGSEKHFDKGSVIILNKGGKEIVIKEWEKYMSTAIWNEKLSRNTSHREQIKFELFKLIKHYNRIEIYSPFEMK